MCAFYTSSGKEGTSSSPWCVEHMVALFGSSRVTFFLNIDKGDQSVVIVRTCSVLDKVSNGASISS